MSQFALRSSLRDSQTFHPPLPSTEVLGYFRLSLRDKTSKLNRHLDLFDLQHVAQDLRHNLDEEAALAAVDVNLRQVEDRALDVDREARARAEGARAADQVARVLLRLREVARVHSFDAQRARQLLGRDLSVAVHQD